MFPYYLIYSIPLLWYFGVQLDCNWLVPAIAFGIFPILELLSPLDGSHSDPAWQHDIRFRLLTWLWVPVHVAVLWTAVNIAPQLSWWSYGWLVLSTGQLTGGIGLNVAHELIHRTDWLEISMGRLLLLLASYPHFYFLHLYGHHKKVGRIDDISTAKYGESIYAFLPRAIWRGLCEAHGDDWALWLIGIYWYFGGLFVMLQSLVAICLLETVNYIEHYGLRREYGEQVSKMHAWNSDKLINHPFMFHIQRHSDHHLHAGKRYQCLDMLPGAPTLPTGYGGCFLLAYIPPLWRAIMHPRLRTLGIQVSAEK